MVGGGSASAMSFHDFAHMLHRYGVMEYADRDDEDGGGVKAIAMRKVFDDAKRGNWPGGSGNVRP